MKSLYVDLDNNKLLAGPLNPLIASQQVFYSGNTETVTVDLIQRDSNFNLLNYEPSTGTTISMVVGIPGSVVSIPAMTRSTQAGITGTATASLYSAITATGTVSKYSVATATVTASLYGNITAQATAVMTRGTACTLSLSVVTAKTPEFRIGFVSRATAATASISTTSVSNYANPFRSSSIFGPGDTFIDIIQGGFGLYGNPQAYFAKPTSVTFGVFSYESKNITNNCTFEDGKIIAIDPSFIDPNYFYPGSSVSISFSSPVTVGFVVNSTQILTTLSASIIVVPDPDYVYSISSISVACGGSGFPSGINIPFTIPSDEDGDGRPCTGLMRAINGSVVSVVSISSRGSRFTSSVTNGKNYGILPSYKIQDITVTCAGAGYYGSAPTITIDSTYFSNSEGTSQAQATAITTVDGKISVILNSSGYGYTATPGVSIQAPRLSDGLRFVTLTNTPTGYADGTYGCTVSGPASGTVAAVNMVVNNGDISFSILNQGTGYVTAPAIACPAPNLADSVRIVTISTAGIGYTSAPTVTIYGAGSGASATATLAADGSIASVQVVSAGTGYTGTTTVGFSAPDNLGKIESIVIATSGTNYTTAPAISFTGGGGSGAAATASVLNGGLYTIELTNGGSGYVTAPAVTIAASPSRTLFTGVLTVTSAFVNSILPSTAVTIQISAASTIGTSTLLQMQGAVAGTI